MSEPFLAEIRLIGFNFAPRGWAFCDGQILPIAQNQSLYSLLGTTYGGDGRTTFALPDLRGRAAMHVDSGPHPRGQRSGAETVALSVAEMPAHGHTLRASSDNANSAVPGGLVLARTTTPLYAAPNNLVALDGSSVQPTGGGQGHENMMPFLTIHFCIALRGLFPSRN